MGTHVQTDGVRKMPQNAAKSPFRRHQKAHRNNVQISLCEPRRDKPKSRPQDTSPPSRRKTPEILPKASVADDRTACRNNVQISTARIDLRNVLHVENMKFFQKHPKTDAKYVSTVEPRIYGNRSGSHLPEESINLNWRIHLRVENRPQDP